MTKKAIITTHDGREATIVTKASNVLFEDGQTAQDILNDRQDTMITPIITTSTSMSKVGQGDSVDYSENVVDGAYESCVLKGNTKVNLIQEPNSQDVVLPYEFEEGQYVTINDTKESGALGVELKGQTLVNLFNSTLPTTNKNSLDIEIIPYKSNTTYTFIVDATTTGEAYQLGFITSSGGGNGWNGNVPNGFSKFTVTTTEAFNKMRATALGSSNTVQINSIVILEGDYTNVDIPYFEGMTSCKMPILHTVGKNLFDYTYWYPLILHNFDYTITGNKINTIIPSGKWFLETARTNFDNLKEDTIYTISATSVNSQITILFWKPDGTLIFERGVRNTPITFTTPNEPFVVSVRFCRRLDSDNTVDVQASCENIQIEEGTVATVYEPYKSSILSLPEEVVLRSLSNRVCDTFNTRTGIYTQMVQEFVFDGSDDEGWVLTNSSTSHETMIAFEVKDRDYMNNLNKHNNQPLLNNLFRVYTDKSWNYFDDEHFRQWGNGSSISWVCVIPRSKLSSVTVEGFKSWLSKNPMKVVAKLKTPIVTKINLPSTLKSWNTTTHIYSEIPENALYPTLSHSNPSYPVILKPSTKYSIVANSYSNNHTNSAINFNLGGATASTTVGNRVTTITTPSTLSNELLTMSGRGNKLNNVMVIEGDVVGDEPYFEGICDCKSPILSNCGKNLFDVDYFVEKVNNPNVCYKNEEGSLVIKGSYHSVKINIPYSTTITYLQTSTNTANNGASIFEAQHPDGTCTHIGVGIDTTLERKTWSIKKPIIAIGFNNWAGGENILKNIMLVKTEDSTAYEPYKSNILSCNGDKIELTEDMLEQGGFSAGSMVLPTYEQCKTSTNSTIRMRSKELIKVSPNTTYIVTNKTLNLNYTTYTFDSNKHFTGEASTTNAPSFTTSPSCQYIAIMFSKGNNSTVVTSDFKESEFQIYEVDKTIVLRSLPNGVCDTLNVETGEYVQRVGEIVLDGSEVWSINTFAPNNKIITFNGRIISNANVIPEVVNYTSDKTTSLPNNFWSSDEVEGFLFMNSKGLAIKIKKEVASTSEELVTYLSQNPITVQYELINPVVKTVDLSGYPFSYENGHVILSSGSIEQSLTPKVEYSLPINRNGQIRSNQKMVEKHQKELDKLQAVILANLINSQYQQTLTTLKYELSRV